MENHSSDVRTARRMPDGSGNDVEGSRSAFQRLPGGADQNEATAKYGPSVPEAQAEAGPGLPCMFRVEIRARGLASVPGGCATRKFCERITLYLAQAGELEALAARSFTVEAKAELLGSPRSTGSSSPT